MFSTKKLLFFIVGIISVVSLFACQKANANQSNVSDTEETQKTVLEMEMNANYSNSDPFENGRLFCVSEDIETLDAEVYFQMDGERGIVEIKDSNLGTFIRTAVVLIMAWGIVFYQRSYHTIKEITKKNWLFLFSSGITTGLSWICYYKALQLGEASIVVPIDKLSIIVTIIFSYFVLKESLSKKAVAGLILIVAGTMLLLI